MRMLSLFPQILFLSPLAPTLLRIAAGLIFLSIAWTHWQKQDELGQIDFVLIGRGVWIPIFASIIELIIGVGLVLGIYAQLAGLLGALGALKFFIWKRRYGAIIPLSRTASVLLLVICLSLVFTGAGAFAFDLPL